MNMDDLCEKFPNAKKIELNALVPTEEVGQGPWRLYIYGKDHLHSGGKWFRLGKMKYPNEEISFARAKQYTEAAVAKCLEVRICDGNDWLVFHSVNGKILFGETFWNEANPDPTATAFANRLLGRKESG